MQTNEQETMMPRQMMFGRLAVGDRFRFDKCCEGGRLSHRGLCKKLSDTTYSTETGHIFSAATLYIVNPA